VTSPRLARRQFALSDAPGLGWVVAKATAGGLVQVRLVDGPAAPSEREEDPEAAAHLARFQGELEGYLRGAAREFTVPLQASGTPFQREVWSALGEVAYGELVTYGALAEALGRPSSVRAVAAAIGRNPLLVVVPCHRVIGAGGRLTGYAAGVERKRALIDLERAAATAPPLMPDADGAGLLTLSLAEAEGVIAALVQGGVPFEEVGPEAAGCAGPEVCVLRFARGQATGPIGLAFHAARGVAP